MRQPCYYETPVRFIACNNAGRFMVEAGQRTPPSAHWLASACERHVSDAVAEAESFTGLPAAVTDRYAGVSA